MNYEDITNEPDSEPDTLHSGPSFNEEDNKHSSIETQSAHDEFNRLNEAGNEQTMEDHEHNENWDGDDNQEEQPDELNNPSNVELIDPADHIAGEERAVPADKRTTTKYLTKYERARVLGARAQQLSLGAPPLIPVDKETDPLVIAVLELKEQKIPIIIRRYLPDNSYEDWSIDELLIDWGHDTRRAPTVVAL
mmetsp:Transcript_21115/g.41859  ORF Transcript_21115/g.41859 Transcript_21115/m.41859 type:complete len:193 (+) Transcript_21115:26-604(+)|eukprot:CAMPEP_0175142366 /NCGR_PEP_ID=MMETSP0087-20121206/12754_1 /TAXON_ID=136419 /ORGANISM="Unknown Unknown, Strain D1" /LENGTH=192 /DNA_ID=CAMNT_0016426151 /DNA_START=26 /DNA_END=604 /DNA_ORIENTATION=-